MVYFFIIILHKDSVHLTSEKDLKKKMWYIQNEVEIQAIFVAFTALQIYFCPFYACVNTTTTKKCQRKFHGSSPE